MRMALSERRANVPPGSVSLKPIIEFIVFLNQVASIANAAQAFDDGTIRPFMPFVLENGTHTCKWNFAIANIIVGKLAFEVGQM